MELELNFPEKLDETLQDALKSNKLSLVEVMIDSDNKIEKTKKVD